MDSLYNIWDYKPLYLVLMVKVELPPVFEPSVVENIMHFFSSISNH